MVNEFVKGFRDAGSVFERETNNEKTSSPVDRQVDQPFDLQADPEHFRLSWLFYLAPDCETLPSRSGIFSRFHSSDQRVPDILVDELKNHQASLAGIFSEPLSPNEDLGYVVFSDEIDAINLAGRVRNMIDSTFRQGTDACGYMYGEIELSRCTGAFSAPAMTVRTGVLLNQGFDCLQQPANILPDEVIEASDRFLS